MQVASNLSHLHERQFVDISVNSSVKRYTNFYTLLAICRPSDRTGVVGVVVVIVVVGVGVCNRSQMRTSKCTCLFFGMSIGLDPG